MKKFTFASLRGADFSAVADTVEDAWKIICEEEKDNGTLWRASDSYMVEHCIRNGWKRLGSNPGVAYKESKYGFLVLIPKNLTNNQELRIQAYPTKELAISAAAQEIKTWNEDGFFNTLSDIEIIEKINKEQDSNFSVFVNIVEICE